MDQRACEKCGEMVSAAKAFCPACGHAFVEEEHREQTTEFQKLDGTMQVGQTMYNQMLSEMGLNISVPAEQATQAVKPALTEISPAVPERRRETPTQTEVLKPISDGPVHAAPVADVPPARNRSRLLLIIGAALIAGWVLVILVWAIFVILQQLRQTSYVSCLN